MKKRARTLTPTNQPKPNQSRRDRTVTPPVGPQPKAVARRARGVEPSSAVKAVVADRLLSESCKTDLEAEGVSSIPKVITSDRGVSGAQSSSGSGCSSEPEDEATKGARARTLAKRGRKRMPKYWDRLWQDLETGPGLLGAEAVGAVRKRYNALTTALKTFMRIAAFSSIAAVSSVIAPQLDRGFVSQFENMFCQGHDPSMDAYLPAGVMHEEPRYSRLGDLRLPRSWRAFRGWKRLSVLPGVGSLMRSQCGVTSRTSWS